MRKTPTHQEKIEDISRVVDKFHCSSLSFSDYRSVGGSYSKWQLFQDGDSWSSLLLEIGITSKTIPQVTDNEYFQRLVHFVEKYKRFLKTSERRKSGLNFSKSRWSTLSLIYRGRKKQRHYSNQIYQ